MRAISIINFKGGVGKTSLAENLSHSLALLGKDVLVIDADRQANASTTLLRGRSSPTLTTVLKGAIPLQEAVHQAKDHLWVVPSDSSLDTASPFILASPAMYYVLRKALAKLSGFDFIFIDHAGAYTPVMAACLLASDSMLIPCELEPYAVQGLIGMFNKLQDTLVDHELHNAGIIPYNVDLRYSMARQYLRELREAFGTLITAPVRTDAMVPKAQSLQMTIFEYEQEQRVRSKAAEDYRTLAEDLMEELGHDR